MVGVTSYGGYIPRYRLSRMVIVQNMAWYFPVIMAVAGGEKSVANWDEDSISMAVAAAYDCMAGKDRKKLDGVYFASTTMPFADRLMVTHIHREFTADTYFPPIDQEEWYVSEEEDHIARDPDGISFTYITYLRRK